MLGFGLPELGLEDEGVGGGVALALVEAGHEIACVYSQPPAPRGRGQALKPSPVHAFALEKGLMVRTPASMRDPEEVAAFQALDLDAAAVAVAAVRRFAAARAAGPAGA